MSYTSNFNLNQRVSYLESEINKIAPIPPGGYNLANVLTIGDNAGANDIDLNGNDILNVSNIDLQTINGTPYPPVVPSSSLFNYRADTAVIAPPVPNGKIVWDNANQLLATQIFVSHLDDNSIDVEVLLKNVVAGNKIILQDKSNSANYQEWLVSNTTLVPNTYILYDVSLVGSTHSFGNNNQISLITQSGIPTQTLSQVLASGNSAGGYDIDLNNNDILQVDNIDLNTINGSAYPPVVPVDDLSAVLTAGNTANNSIILTDGIDTTTITKTSITATTFNGALSGNASTATSATNATNAVNTAITASATNASFYPTFVSATTGDLPQLVDSDLTYNPSTNTLSATTFKGNFIPTTESVSGTNAISPTIQTTILTGSTHTLASGTTIGQEKLIVNNNNNCWEGTGTFTSTLGGSAFINVMKYDATSNRMYIGGTFTSINGNTSIANVGYYDLTALTWNAMGTGTNGNVLDLIITGGRVYICGSFALAGGVANTARIAYWDIAGATWNAMGTGFSGSQVNKMIEYSGDIYAGAVAGLFGGVANTNAVARWNIAGATWNAMGTGAGGGNVNTILNTGTDIWIGGTFSSAGGVANTAFFARWDTIGLAWNGYGANQFSSAISIFNWFGGNIIIITSGSVSQSGINYTNTIVYNVSTGLFQTTTFLTNSNITNITIDSAGTYWGMGGYTSIGNILSVQPQPSTFHQGIYAPCYFNTTLNKWVPINTFTQNGSMTCIAEIGSTGVYWFGGNATGIDNNNIYGVGQVFKFTKANLQNISVSNLLLNGRTDRNNFNFTWKGQSVRLVNIDNTNWVVSDTSMSYASNNGGQGQILFY